MSLCPPDALVLAEEHFLDQRDAGREAPVYYRDKDLIVRKLPSQVPFVLSLYIIRIFSY